MGPAFLFSAPLLQQNFRGDNAYSRGHGVICNPARTHFLPATTTLSTPRRRLGHGHDRPYRQHHGYQPQHYRAPLTACAPQQQQPPRDVSRDVKELRSVLKKCSVYFVGPMGSGKSAVAKFMATKIGFRFLDTDALIEAYAGKPISAIFAEDGEENFRDVETAVLDQVAPFIACCVATGGGAVLRKENWGRLHTGIVVYLDTPIDVLADRLQASESETSNRPLLKDAEDIRQRVEDILAERRDLYEQADVSIKVTDGMAVDDIATETIRLLTNFIKANPPRLANLYPGNLPKKE